MINIGLSIHDTIKQFCLYKTAGSDETSSKPSQPLLITQGSDRCCLLLVRERRTLAVLFEDHFQIFFPLIYILITAGPAETGIESVMLLKWCCFWAFVLHSELPSQVWTTEQRSCTETQIPQRRKYLGEEDKHSDTGSRYNPVFTCLLLDSRLLNLRRWTPRDTCVCKHTSVLMTVLCLSAGDLRRLFETNVCFHNV